MSESYYDDWYHGVNYSRKPLKYVHPISQPDRIRPYLKQTAIWTDHEGVDHRIKDMDKEYIFNVLSWLRQNQERINFTYNFKSIVKPLEVDTIGPGSEAFGITHVIVNENFMEQPLVKRLEKRYLKLSGL